MKANKERTLAQVEAMKAKAVRFVRDVLDDDDRADEIEDESPESYAERKHIAIVDNPRRFAMPETKQELSEALEDICEILEDALDPKLSREAVIAKVEEAYAIASGDDEDEGEEETEDDEEEGEGE